MEWVIAAIRAYFALVLFVSGVAKLRAPRAFEETLSKHGVVPSLLRPFTARAFPAFEVSLAVALISNLGVGFVDAVVAATFLTFVALESYLIVTHKATECGCFGVAFRQRVEGTSVATSGLQFVLAMAVAWLLLAGRNSPLPAATALIAGAALASLTATLIARRHFASDRGHALASRTSHVHGVSMITADAERLES